ncbi:unnamed protein product [Coregonus sp. 'balchen']|nr:unnamed protein product [Coregonus sp. 'balchen']
MPSGGLFGVSSAGAAISVGGKWPPPSLSLAPSAKLHFGAATAGGPPQGSLFGSPSTSSMTTAPGVSFGSLAGMKAIPPLPPPGGSAPPTGFSFRASPTGGPPQGSGISLLPTTNGAHLTRPLGALHGSTRSSSEATGPPGSSLLGSLLCVDVDYFANVFLKKKGISSLGRLHYRLILSRVRRLEEGKLLLSLFRLDLDHSPPQPRCERWEAVRRAVDWVCWADREYPCVCSRLEFGWDWESSTRQLLGIDPPHPLSPLILLRTRGGVRAQ